MSEKLLCKIYYATGCNYAMTNRRMPKCDRVLQTENNLGNVKFDQICPKNADFRPCRPSKCRKQFGHCLSLKVIMPGRCDFSRFWIWCQNGILQFINKVQAILLNCMVTKRLSNCPTHSICPFSFMRFSQFLSHGRVLCCEKTYYTRI